MSVQFTGGHPITALSSLAHRDLILVFSDSSTQVMSMTLSALPEHPKVALSL